MNERRASPRDGEPVRIPVVEERATIEKERRETGKVRVRVRDRVERQELDARLTEQHVEVASVARDEVLATRPEPRMEGDTYVFPVAEEILVVETRWRLVEEVRVRPIADERQQTVPVDLERREVLIERDDRSGAP